MSSLIAEESEEVRKLSGGHCSLHLKRVQLGIVADRRSGNGVETIAEAASASNKVPASLTDISTVERDGLSGQSFRDAVAFVSSVPCVRNFLVLSGVNKAAAGRFFAHCAHRILACCTLPLPYLAIR